MTRRTSVSNDGGISIELPSWLLRWTREHDQVCGDSETRIGLAIELSRLNVERGTGGPFGAAVFDRASGRLVAAGVNLVVAANNSVAHAEMIAIMLAQRSVGTYDLGAGGRDCELAASTEPCAMCLGAVPWSGVRSLVCAATDADARAAGFDEGAKPADWVRALNDRGIAVRTGVRRDAAAAVLRSYRDAGGVLYNAGPGRGAS